MNAQPERADRELLGSEGEFTPSFGTAAVSQWRVDGINPGSDHRCSTTT